MWLSPHRQQFNCERCGERISAWRATRAAQTRRGAIKSQPRLDLTALVEWRHPRSTFSSVHSAWTQRASVAFSKPTWKRRTSPQISANGFIDISSTPSRMTPQGEVPEFNLRSCSKLQKVTPSPPPCPSDGVFLRDVSCYFSVLEDGRPRDKLECGFLLLSAFNVVWQNLICIPLLRPDEGPGERDKSLPVFDLLVVTFKLYDKDGNGLLDSAVSLYFLYLLCSLFFV